MISSDSSFSSRISDHITKKLLDKNKVDYSIMKYAKGATLISLNDICKFVFIIVSGEFKVYIPSESGKEVILNTLNRGEIIGELAAITELPSSASIISTMDSHVIVIKKDSFIRFLKTQPEIMFQLLKYLSIRTQKLSNKVADFVLSDVYGRIVKLLNNQARDNIIDGLTHQDIASEVGSSREMTSKILGNLKLNNFINVGRKKITILKPLPQQHSDYKD